MHQIISVDVLVLECPPGLKPTSQLLVISDNSLLFKLCVSVEPLASVKYRGHRFYQCSSGIATNILTIIQVGHNKFHVKHKLEMWVTCNKIVFFDKSKEHQQLLFTLRYCCIV